jgi:hypothetical protein
MSVDPKSYHVNYVLITCIVSGISKDFRESKKLSSKFFVSPEWDFNYCPNFRENTTFQTRVKGLQLVSFLSSIGLPGIKSSTTTKIMAPAAKDKA